MCTGCKRLLTQIKSLLQDRGLEGGGGRAQDPLPSPQQSGECLNPHPRGAGAQGGGQIANPKCGTVAQRYPALTPGIKDVSPYVAKGALLMWLR